MKQDKANNSVTHKFVTNDALHQLFDQVSAISVQGYDEQRRVIYWNKGSEHLYGYSAQEASGQKLEALIIPVQMRQAVIDAHANWLNNGVEIPSAELMLQHKDGAQVCVYSSHVLFENQYNIKQMYCIDIDLTEMKKAQGQAVFKDKVLETIFAAIPDLFFLMHADGTIIDYHASDKNNLYVKPEEFIGKKMSEVLPEEISAQFQANIAKALKQQQMVSFQYALQLPQGAKHFEARVTHVQQYQHVMTIIRDITEQHEADELIRQQAYFDSLTSLPNRFLALDNLSKILLNAEQHNDHAAVCFIDLDDFKKINDSLGHEVGDKLLIKAAARLKHVISDKGMIGRLGGDEFIVLLHALPGADAALQIISSLLDSFKKPFEIEGRELIVTLSAGIAMYPDNGNAASDLLRNADTAMYHAKALGRNTYSFFTEQMNVIIKRRLIIEEQMRSALERDEFELYYQPQFGVKSQQIIGAEALLRWHNPVLGHITPDEFIPIAENTGLIVPIGQFVISQALAFLNQWQSSCAQQQKYTMAVNLSPRQFKDEGLLSFIQSSLLNAQIPPESLELEITEGVLMSYHTNVIGILNEITAAGINLAMDDFGTGYSSLSYLRDYPFNVLKIDRGFIDNMVSNNEDFKLVKAIIEMSHSLGLKVVAEGVESQKQHTLLCELECDFMQGYYFSKPIPAKQFIDFARNFK